MTRKVDSVGIEVFCDCCRTFIDPDLKVPIYSLTYGYEWCGECHQFPSNIHGECGNCKKCVRHCVCSQQMALALGGARP